MKSTSTTTRSTRSVSISIDDNQLYPSETTKLFPQEENTTTNNDSSSRTPTNGSQQPPSKESSIVVYESSSVISREYDAGAVNGSSPNNNKDLITNSTTPDDCSYTYNAEDEDASESVDNGFQLWTNGPIVSIRRIALTLSLYINLIITATKLVAYVQTWSLSVLASLLDSVLDVVSQIVLNYTERHSSLQRSSALYPAGASRLEPVGVLTCAALMGMASFEVLKQSIYSLIGAQETTIDSTDLSSFYSMLSIVLVKLFLLWLCHKGANKRPIRNGGNGGSVNNDDMSIITLAANSTKAAVLGYDKAVVQLADPTLEALAQDHWNDCLSNVIAAVALLLVCTDSSLWFLDPLGAIIISLYIIYSWYITGKEQIEQLTGKSAPEDFIDELREFATTEFDFSDRVTVDVIRAYHFGPKFLVEIEIVMSPETSLLESHDVGMEIQYEIEAREEVERCFVHIDYETRPYDEHVVSKVPYLREKYRPSKQVHNKNLFLHSSSSV